MFSFSVDGKVYKVVQWFDESTKQGKSELLDIFEVTSPEPIRMMEISPKVWIILFYFFLWLVYFVLILFFFFKKHKSIYATSDHRIRQVNMVMCNGRYDNCLRCVRDPYCGWDKESNSCKPYAHG